MVDIRQELEKKIQESNQRQMSLSDRLNYLDNFNKDIAVPQISSPGPKGTNPMNSLNALFQMITNRKSVAGDVTAERNTGTDLLGQLANYEQANKPKEVDPYDELLKQLTVQEKLKVIGKQIDPKTGNLIDAPSPEALDALELINDISDDDIKPLTGFLRVRGVIPGTKAYDTKAKLTRLRDTLALKARAAIRGTGTISDVEQKMLANAQTLLKTGISEDEFRTELDRLKKNAMEEAGISENQSGDKAGDFTIEKVE